MAEELKAFSKDDRVLFLVESPEKAQTIGKIFRDAGYNKVITMATIGHFDTVADGKGYCNTGIHPEDNFKMDFIIDSDKKAHVEKIKEQVKCAKLVVVASDPDREGEAIAWACVKFFKLTQDKYIRITYQAINKKAIFEALNNAGKVDTYLTDSAHSRLCVDKMFGYSVSGVLRRNKKGRSGGRVQSAALRMIVDRELEIINFVPEKYIDLFLHFSKDNTEFKAKYVGTDDNPVKRLEGQSQVDRVMEECTGHSFNVKYIEHKNKFENPKPPFCTATLQQECFNKLGLTTDETDKYTQKLFESGKISYHRTDSERFEEEFTNELKTFVKAHFPGDYISGTVVEGKTDENAQEGHEALHVLDLNLTPDLFAQDSPSEILSKVYRIIYNRTVATALKPAIVSQTTYNIYNGNHKFTMNSNEPVFDGFKCVYSYKDDSDEQDEILSEIFAEGEELQNCSFEAIAKETTPPARYKESSFVAEMKKVGIGRPSTYAATIKTIKSESRGYCTVEKNYLKPTQLGMENIAFLKEKFSKFVDINYTKQLEKELDAIANNKLDKTVFLKDFYTELDGTLKGFAHADPNTPKPKAEVLSETCPECGKPLVKRVGKYGEFIGCSGYPRCKYIKK